jgi:hypothetical protein
MQVNQEKVNIHDLMVRFKSKNELHNFLAQDCKAYLPKLDSTNVYFLKDLFHGTKEVFPFEVDCLIVFEEIGGESRLCSSN